MASSMKEAFGTVTAVDSTRQMTTFKRDFPRRPLMDKVIVREIPLKEYYQQPEGVTVDLDNSNIRERSDRGEVVAISMKVGESGEVKVGDTVFFDEFCLCDPVYLNPADKNRPDLPKYWQMRVADLKGVLNA